MIIVIYFNKKVYSMSLRDAEVCCCYVISLYAFQPNEIQVYAIKLCCRNKFEVMYSARSCQVR
jgi:hypothetical protein